MYAAYVCNVSCKCMSISTIYGRKCWMLYQNLYCERPTSNLNVESLKIYTQLQVSVPGTQRTATASLKPLILNYTIFRWFPLVPLISQDNTLATNSLTDFSDTMPQKRQTSTTPLAHCTTSVEEVSTGQPSQDFALHVVTETNCTRRLIRLKNQNNENWTASVFNCFVLQSSDFSNKRHTFTLLNSQQLEAKACSVMSDLSPARHQSRPEQIFGHLKGRTGKASISSERAAWAVGEFFPTRVFWPKAPQPLQDLGASQNQGPPKFDSVVMECYSCYVFCPWK